MSLPVTETYRKYNDSSKGKARIERYQQTEAAKEKRRIRERLYSKTPRRRAYSAIKNACKRGAPILSSTEEIVELIITRQVCGICGAGNRRLVIDHDHGEDGRGGPVRDMLCNGCNCLVRSTAVLRQALAYVEKHAIKR